MGTPTLHTHTTLVTGGTKYYVLLMFYRTANVLCNVDSTLCLDLKLCTECKEKGLTARESLQLAFTIFSDKKRWREEKGPTIELVAGLTCSVFEAQSSDSLPPGEPAAAPSVAHDPGS